MLGSAQTNINVFTPEDLQPGKPCDTLRYVITYDMAYVEDTLQVPMKAAHETMLLETGRKVTAFYSYDAFRSDSINAGLLSRGATQYSVLGRIPWRLYTNYPETGRSSFTEKLGLDRFVCVESVEKPQWQLCPDSSATILGYPCRLAMASYKGACGAHGMPRTYLSTMGRGSSADCPDSYCGLTTANAIMCLMR